MHETKLEWSDLRKVATGDRAARQKFSTAYLEVVRAFLQVRWQGTANRGRVEDAVQDVFLDFFKPNGALQRLDPARTLSFRAFLFGVTNKVALRYEQRLAAERRRRSQAPFEPDQLPTPATSDREWAKGVLRRAHERMASAAATTRARRRVDLLTLRYREDLPIREIAARWSVDPAYLHHESAIARREYKQALRAEVAADLRSATGLDERCRQLLRALEETATSRR